MAIDPRLMMVDYSQLGDIGASIGQGIQGYRMNKTRGIAGRALMGDPTAMQELAQRDPMAAQQVQAQLSEQQAAARQAQMEEDKNKRAEIEWLSNQQERYGKMFARTRNPEEARKLHGRLMASDPMYQYINQGLAPEGQQEAYSDDDFTTARMIYGQGFGDMEFKDLVNMYESNPVVKDMMSTKNSATNIANAYKQLQENPNNQAAQFAIAKSAIQMIESGVVRPEEFAAAAGIALPSGLTGEELVGYLNTKFRGGLTLEQATNLARMGISSYNTKVANVKQLQQDMIGAGLGAYDPENVFATAKAQELEDITAVQRSTDVIKTVEQAVKAGWKLMTDRQGNKAYVGPNNEVLEVK